MVHRQQYGDVFIGNEALYIAIDLHYHASLVEHLQGANDGTPLADVIGNWDSGFGSSGARS
jgi:hypothetical protein